MARTHSSHSSHTASPRRRRSPQRSAARRSGSEDGSQYEMDLDALGLSSTFESTALEGSHEPAVDRVATSEVEGPDDFTMNMTYWMTADLQQTGEEGEESEGEGAGEGNGEVKPAAAAAASTAASPTVRVHDTTASREYSTPASERSMANEEKVRSFLSALPDTELDHHLSTASPLRVPRQGMLHIPRRSSPPKARTLQPTVEDHDMPRKPTQSTVIHHPEPKSHDEQDTSADRVVGLQSRLDQHELASRTRITELETILSYTRTELDAARTDNYTHKHDIARLEGSLQEQQTKHDAHAGSLASRLKALEDGHQTQLQRLDETLRQEHERTLQAQREQLERRLREAETSDRKASEEAQMKTQELESVQEQLTQLKHSTEQAQRQKSDQESEQAFAAERIELLDKLTSLQTRADSLQVHLTRATAEAKTARQESHARESVDAALKVTSHRQLSRITDLETQLKDVKFSLECAQADVAAKEQLFRTNINLNVDLRALRSELEAQQTTLADLTSGHNRRSTSDEQLQSELASKDQLIEQRVAERDSLERQLNTAQGRIAGLETRLSDLRAQLTDAHRETGTARAGAERLTQDLEDANDRLVDARAEADRRVADVEKKLAKTKDLRAEAESNFRELKSQHDDLVEGHAAMLEDVRDKAEDAVRKTGALLAQERKEKTRLKKDIERLQREINDLRADEHTAPFDEDSDTTTPFPAPKPVDDTQEKEIASLKSIIKTQLTELKTLKSSHASTMSSLQTSHEASLNMLRSEISSLQHRLETQAHDHAAINAAMDDQLSALLSKLMKERARTVVGKRDGQWEEVQRSNANEKELLGKVLMRQWGREECGVAPEDKGKKQLYEYKFVRKRDEV